MSKFVNGFHSQNVGSTWATSWRELNWIMTDYEWCRFVIINTGNREMTPAVPWMSTLRQGWRSISIRQRDFSSFPRIRECLTMWFNVLALILVTVIQNNEKRILTHYIPIIYIYIILMSYFIQKHGKVIIIIINDLRLHINHDLQHCGCWWPGFGNQDITCHDANQNIPSKIF